MSFLGELAVKNNIVSRIVDFYRRKEGVTAIEYALIAALVAVVIIAAASSLGTSIVNVFNAVSSQLSSAA
jgi:pilus assembly protein Flp/PilA